MAAYQTIAPRYIEFLRTKPSSTIDENWELFFSSNVKKVVNSNTICNNRNQLIQQMIIVEKEYGVQEVHLLESIECLNNKTSVIRFEITYNDSTIEVVIAILKCDENGLIEEINEVFGQKSAYQWHS